MEIKKKKKKHNIKTIRAEYNIMNIAILPQYPSIDMLYAEVLVSSIAFGCNTFPLCIGSYKCIIYIMVIKIYNSLVFIIHITLYYIVPPTDELLKRNIEFRLQSDNSIDTYTLK